MKTLVAKIFNVLALPFRLIERLFKYITPFRWLEKDMPVKGKILIAVLLLVSITGGGYTAFRFYDFTQNNPNFCVSCHLMKPAFEAWEKSVHQEINCHDCHHLSVAEMNQLLVSFVFQRPEHVPERHGKVIVPWKYCIQCHWEKDEDYPQASQINDSRLHAKHYFMEKIECAECHGYITHEFVPEEKFCVKCHGPKEVHGEGMGEIACLNCHTDRTPDLRPGRNKCLFCHGAESVREQLKADATLDVTHYAPDAEIIERATKIDVPKDAPMQFSCYTCHKPHEEVRPDWGDCVNCHRKVLQVGQHRTHVQMMGMQCSACHKPHSWTVTEERARKLCVTCHEYRSPMEYLKG